MVWTNPRTWVAGETVSASIMNAHVRDNLNAWGTWTAYSPSVSFTLGNGTCTGLYIKAGDTVQLKIEFTFGSTSSASGNLQFSIAPGTAVDGAGTAGYPLDGNVWVYDTSASAGTYYYPSATASGGFVLPRSANGSPVNASTITWANGDRCVIWASYKAA